MKKYARLDYELNVTNIFFLETWVDYSVIQLIRMCLATCRDLKAQHALSCSQEEISTLTRSKIIDIYQFEMGCKAISDALRLTQRDSLSTNGEDVAQRWTFPVHLYQLCTRSASPTGPESLVPPKKELAGCSVMVCSCFRIQMTCSKWWRHKLCSPPDRRLSSHSFVTVSTGYRCSYKLWRQRYNSHQLNLNLKALLAIYSGLSVT